jgi:predicted DNA-binding ribbon-helix-helix protein
MRAPRAADKGSRPGGATTSPARSGRPLKRSFTIGGHRTSISLEGAFWEALRAAASREGVPVSRLIARIDAHRSGCGLSSAIRVWLLAYHQRGAQPPSVGG